mgnify:FL=1
MRTLGYIIIQHDFQTRVTFISFVYTSKNICPLNGVLMLIQFVFLDINQKSGIQASNRPSELFHIIDIL